MPTFSHTIDADVLGLATAGDIILVDATPVVEADIIDLLSEAGIVLKTSGKAIGQVKKCTLNYELKAASLTLALGVDVGDSGWRILSASGTYSAEGYPTVSVTAVAPDGSSSFATGVAHGSITFPGGFGMPGTFMDATVTGGISASASVSGQVAKAIGGNTGEVLAEGIAVYGFRGVEVSIEAFSAIALPTGCIQSGKSDTFKSGREAFEVHSIAYRKYLVDN